MSEPVPAATPLARPLISVITATFNALDGLKRTAASLAAQRFRDFEWIVVDGGSKDGTASFLAGCGALVTRFVSEPDRGIHDAWNKGLGMARGEWVAFLNADDLYHPDTLGRAAEACVRHPDSLIVGTTKLVRDGEIVRTYRPRIRRDWRLGVGFAHPSTLMPRRAFDELGPFEPKRIAMDTDFLLRALKRGMPVVPAAFSVYMAWGGVSTKSPVKAFREYQQVLVEHGLQTPRGVCRHVALYAGVQVARGLAEATRARTLARHGKHLAALAMNLGLRLVCLDPLRRLALRALRIEVAPSSWVAPTTTFYGPGRVRVGEHSVVNRGCLLDNRDAITIGRGVSIAHGCSLITAGHDIDAPYFDYQSKPVRVGDHAVLFAKAMLMPGATVGEGAVILANSVVAGDVPPYTVYGGVPARFVRERPRSLHYRIAYKFPFSL